MRRTATAKSRSTAAARSSALPAIVKTDRLWDGSADQSSR